TDPDFGATKSGMDRRPEIQRSFNQNGNHGNRSLRRQDTSPRSRPHKMARGRPPTLWKHADHHSAREPLIRDSETLLILAAGQNNARKPDDPAIRNLTEMFFVSDIKDSIRKQRVEQKRINAALMVWTDERWSMAWNFLTARNLQPEQ